MKRLFLLSVAALSLFNLNAQQEDERVLLTVNGKPSTVSDFMYIYQKNSQEAQVEQKTIDEYLDLYINFRLKVVDAEQQGLDTTASFKKELKGYRDQAIPKYMSDAESERDVLLLAYSRMQNDRRVSHIAIRCAPNASKEEETMARNKIETAYERVTTGLPIVKRNKTLPGTPEDFNKVAMEVSEDPGVNENEGHIGWVRPFRFIYSFEDATYNTPVGGISQVFRTPFGFHIVKVEEEVPHREVHAAHIMKMTPNGNDSIAVRAYNQIDSIYSLLKDGADFTELATNLSDDRGSAIRGGDLGFFSRGQMVPEFENTAFALVDSADITRPFRSAYGWHIIQYRGSRGVGNFELIENDIRRNVSRSQEYHQMVEDGFIDKLKSEYQYAATPYGLEPFSVIESNVGNITDSAAIVALKTLPVNDPLFYYAGKYASQQQFAEFIVNYKLGKMESPKVDDLYKQFVGKTLREYEESVLEYKYPELRHLMQEYHDGILLFDVSLKEVWDRASLDTAGIKTFFKQNKKNYKWEEPRYKGYVIYAKDKTTANVAKNIIKMAEPDSIQSYIKRRLNTDSTNVNVRVENGLFRQGGNKAVDKYGFKLKTADFTPTEELPVVVLVGKKLKNPEEYTDERQKVTADYQDYLEKQWIKALKEKYEVVVDQEVLNSIR